jgi:rRNA maturation RNase YbeY
MKPFPKLLHSKNIEFFYNTDDFELSSPEKYASWCESIFHAEKKHFEHVGYFFCSDEQILEMNKKFLNHDTLTDILTFPLEDDPIYGEIFISVDRITENAKIFNQPFEIELVRVMSHGILHLCGYDDHTLEEKKIIRAKENKYISLFSI